MEKERESKRDAMKHIVENAKKPKVPVMSGLVMAIIALAIFSVSLQSLTNQRKNREEEEKRERKEKVQEICTLIPALRKEIDWTRGQTLEGKDYAKYVFKNGSYFDNIAARESSRGKRRHGGVIEECVGVDGTILSEVIIPTMNISRMCMDGTTHPEE